MESEHPAKKIKFLARLCQMSFQELADRAGLTLEALRDFLDERAVPPPSLLRRIAAALGVGEKFFGLSEGEPAPSSEAALRSSAAGSQAARRTSRPVARGGASTAIGVAELAARHEALLRSLVESGLLKREEYERRLVEARARRSLRRPPSRPSSAAGRSAPPKPRSRRPPA